MSVAADSHKRLITALLRLENEEIDCDEFFECVDCFADTLREGKDADSLMPLVRAHISRCPSCQEELEALLHSLEAQES
ncbi:MAG: hypothetical protein GX605_02780 [Chloroflexi bacterium]|nr:hypothetical protein [Chloroflexota bacterium]